MHWVVLHSSPARLQDGMRYTRPLKGDTMIASKLDLVRLEPRPHEQKLASGWPGRGKGPPLLSTPC